MKLNNKGYAITVIVFGILIVFIIVLSSLLVTMNNSVKLNKTVKEDVIENIQLNADTTGMSLTERIEQIENKLSNIASNSNVIDTIYPVGSIYISATDDSIEDVVARFGGQWEVYAQGRTLVGVGSTTDANGNSLIYNAGELNEDGTTYKGQTGGSVLTSLSTSNLPSHNHTYTPSGSVSSTFTGTSTSTSNAGKHSHTISGTSGSTGSGYTITKTNSTRTTTTNGEHQHNGLNWYNKGSISLNAGSAVDGIKLTFVGGGQLAEDYKGIYTNYAGDHTHTVKDYYANKITGVESHSHSFNATSSEVSNHAHTVTATGNVSSKFTGEESNTGNTGTGASFNVQDPYITVYMYKRIK